MNNPNSGFLSGAALKMGGAKQEIVDMVGEERPNPASDVPTLDALREMAWAMEARNNGEPVCREVDPEPYFLDMARAAMPTIERLSAELEQREDGLRRIQQWADAYPLDIFPEPDLEAVKAALSAAGILNQMDRMHSSWARYIVSGIRDIADEASNTAEDTQP